MIINTELNKNKKEIKVYIVVKIARIEKQKKDLQYLYTRVQKEKLEIKLSNVIVQ